MQITTELKKTDFGAIEIERFTEKIKCLFDRRRKLSFEFFLFSSVTTIQPAAAEPVKIRTNRKMPVKLLNYFLTNQAFQARVLKENERSAIRFFQK